MFLFKVKGSSGNYTVTIGKNANNLIATCTCNAAKNGMACKHRLDILKGDDSCVIENKDAMANLPAFIHDTTEYILLNEISSLESKAEEIKKQVADKKKLLAKILPI